MINDRGDSAPAPGPISTSPLEAQGIDRLVELHVLAEHGDPAAAAAAHRWLATDAAARRVWETVERTCAELRRARETHPEQR